MFLMMTSTLNKILELEDGSILPVNTVDHLHIRFLKWIALMMDQYRDIRLVWTLIESLLLFIIVALIIYFIYRVKTVEGCLRLKYKALDDRVRKIAELHKRADELEAEDKEVK
jgi:hypothetical protein